ncbi:MAG: hypothetical protein RR645_06850, partial [Clostridium sp.]
IVKEVKMKTGKEYIVTKIELKEANNEFDFIGIKYIEIRRQSKDSTVIPVNKVEIGKSSKVEDEGTRDKEVLRILENDFNILSTEVKFLK